MAPHDPNQNRIDVSLNIMSDATLTAVNQLTDQLSTLREFLAGQQMAGNPAAQAQSAGGWVAGAGVAQVYNRPGEVQAGIFHGPSATVRVGDPSNPSQGAQASKDRAKQLEDEYKAYQRDMEARSGAKPGWGPGGIIPSRPDPVMNTIGPDMPLSPDANAMMSRRMSDPQRWKLAGQEARVGGGSRMSRYGARVDQFFARYQGSSRDPSEDRAYEFEAGEGQEGPSDGMPAGMGAPSRGPKGPNVDPNTPGWSQTLQRDGISSTSNFGMTVPRLGEFTTQDKLRMAAKFLGRAAQRSQESGGSGVATTIAGRTAATASYLADNAALLTSLHHGYQRVKGYAAEQTAAGAELGFSADTGAEAEFLGVGARLNLPGMSEASREGLHQELTQRRVAAAAGVSTAQAKEIRATVRGMGYSGDTAEDLSYNLFKPLAKRGISSETWAPVVDQGFRQGTMSVTDLRDSIYGLAKSAKNANLTMDEARDATIAYTEAMQGMGGSMQNALRGSETMMTAGLDPKIAAEAVKSPLTQGVLTMKYGLPPEMQGVLGPGMQMEGMNESARIAMAAGQGWLDTPDTVLRSHGGQIIEKVTGEDKRLAFAQNMSGMPRTVLERMQRNPNFLKEGGRAATMITAMDEQIGKMKGVKTTKHKDYGRRTGRGSHEAVTEVTDKATGKLTKAQEASLRGEDQTNDIIQYGDLEEQLRTMDPGKDWQNKVSKITNKKDGTIDLKKAKDLVKEATDPTKEPDYLVGLTNQAKGLLTIMPNKNRKDAKDNANKGGAAVNGAYGGASTGNAPTGAATAGVPGG